MKKFLVELKDLILFIDKKIIVKASSKEQVEEQVKRDMPSTVIKFIHEVEQL
jgi:hypothetical protein